MALDSDIVLNGAKFSPSAAPADLKEFNSKLGATLKDSPQWYNVGAKKYRAMRDEGKTPLPKPVLLDCAAPFSVPSRDADAGRTIPCRVIRPEGKPTGVFMHIHGGGWVLGDEDGQDVALKGLVDDANVVTITVGYRLAPEDPFPAGPQDCYDVAEWLVDNAEKEFGAPLKFISGESAGGHLSALTAFHLLSHSNTTYSNFQLKGLVLHYGGFDLSNTPTVYSMKDDPLLTFEGISNFEDAFLPDPKTNRKDPSISPLYFDFASLRESKSLPPALFTCGTADRLLDDTIFMSSKWQVWGGETIVKIVPGAPHGYTLLSPDQFPSVAESKELVLRFMKERL